MTDRVSSPEQTSLAQRIVTAPRLNDAALAALRVNAWLEELSPADSGEIGELMRASLRLETVLHSVAENSPFLWDLVSRDAQRLLRLLRSDPDAHFERVLAEADGTGHAENFARIALPHGTARGSIVTIIPTCITEGLLA